MTWQVVPSYLVRTAGFSFARLDALRSPTAPAAVAAADAALAVRAAAGATLEAALERVRFADLSEFDDPARRKPLTKAFSAVRGFSKAAVGSNGAAVEPPSPAIAEVTRLVPTLAPLTTALTEAHASWRAAAETASRVFTAELEAARAAIRAMYASDPRIRDAVFIESPEAALKLGALVSKDNDGPRNARARAKERVATMYAQRFCAKNDSNSMCGPASIEVLEAPRTSSPDARITVADAPERRVAYFSSWAAQTLLDRLLADAGDAAPITYVRNLTARLDADVASWCVMSHDSSTRFHRRHARTRLPELALPLVRAIATTPLTRAELRARAAEERWDLDDDELHELLENLVTSGLVLRGPNLPPGTFFPLRALAAELANGAWPPAVSAQGLAHLAALEQGLDDFGRAPLADRPKIYDLLVQRFVAATGAEATRGAGSHYADRAILHEDGHVPIAVELGAARSDITAALPTLLDTLELPVELARERVREWYRTRFAGRTRVPALEVHRAFDEDAVLTGAATTPRADGLREAVARVRALFSSALSDAATHGGAARLVRAELAAAVASAPTTRRPGYVSCDVLLAGRPGARPEVVVGEIHGFFAYPTCTLDVMPEADRARATALLRSAIADVAGGRRTADCLFLHTQATDRRVPLGDVDLAMILPADRDAGRAATQLGELDMELLDDEFRFTDAAGLEIVPLLAYVKYPFVQYTSPVSALFDDLAERYFPDSFLPADFRRHDSPRIYLDDVVVLRRTWRRSVAEIRAALAAETDIGLFGAAQRLRAALGCERCVFVSVPRQPKPILVDFECVFLVEAFAHALVGSPDEELVRVSEMLPGPDALIAAGSDGPRTSELRFGFYRTR